MRVLQRHVQIRQHMAVVHQRDDFVDMRIRIDVVQPHPGTVLARQFAQRADQFGHPRLQRTAVPEAGTVLDVDAVGTRVLRNDQQFLDAGLEQVLGLEHHLGDRTRHQVAAHRGDDAERAAVIAALGNLQVGVVLGRQLDAGGRHQIDEGVVRLGKVRVHRLHDLAERMGAGDGQYLRMHAGDDIVAAGVLLGAKATGDDDLAVLGQRLADRVQALLHRLVDKAAGIDDHQIGTVIGAADGITLGTQLGDDLFGIDEGLGATE